MEPRDRGRQHTPDTSQHPAAWRGYDQVVATHWWCTLSGTGRSPASADPEFPPRRARKAAWNAFHLTAMTRVSAPDIINLIDGAGTSTRPGEEELAREISRKELRAEHRRASATDLQPDRIHGAASRANHAGQRGISAGHFEQIDGTPGATGWFQTRMGDRSTPSRQTRSGRRRRL